MKTSLVRASKFAEFFPILNPFNEENLLKRLAGHAVLDIFKTETFLGAVSGLFSSGFLISLSYQVFHDSFTNNAHLISLVFYAIVGEIMKKKPKK